MDGGIAVLALYAGVINHAIIGLLISPLIRANALAHSWLAAPARAAQTSPPLSSW